MRIAGILLLAALMAACATTKSPDDYSDFAELSAKRKKRVVWELHDRRAWGLPEHKPVCRDLLENQGYRATEATAWTIHAIDLAERQGWTDLNPLVSNIVAAPRDIGIYERAFRYLRHQDGRPVSSNVVENIQIVRRAGFYRSTVTDEELAKAQERLMQDPDKEALLVYALGVGCRHPGKGGTDRGRKVAIALLETLRREDVVSRLRQLHRDGASAWRRQDVEWVAERMHVELGEDAPIQARERPTPKPGATRP